MQYAIDYNNRKKHYDCKDFLYIHFNESRLSLGYDVIGRMGAGLFTKIYSLTFFMQSILELFLRELY